MTNRQNDMDNPGPNDTRNGNEELNGNRLVTIVNKIVNSFWHRPQKGIGQLYRKCFRLTITDTDEKYYYYILIKLIKSLKI